MADLSSKYKEKQKSCHLNNLPNRAKILGRFYLVFSLMYLQWPFYHLAGSGHAGAHAAISSVQTRKPVSVFGPKV
jgi:hypothetical protein